MTLFDRRVRVVVGDRSFDGESSVDGQRQNGFRVSFKVEQSLTSTSNTCEATIYNLSGVTRTSLTDLIRPGFRIDAGYASEMGTIFSGTAERVFHKRTLPGIETMVSATDGSKEGKKIVNKALAPGATLAEAIELIATTMNVSAVRAIQAAKAGDFSVSFKSFINGLTLSGTAKHELDKLMFAQGADWTITNGELTILRPGKATTETAVVLSVDTGLIGSVERITDKKRAKKLLYKATSLLQGALRPGRRVEMRSRDLVGSFRVEKATHIGDTHGPEWTSEVQLAELTS